ncbi:MAG: AI-2E family transporter, partial [Egibacteraceae bacterium]
MWTTLGRYFRGQLLVAAVDAVLIGLGLLLLGIPLAVPLAVLIFFGGLFPIVGAVTSGVVAVLVALADAGLATALIVLGLIVAVQQLESNVLEPVVLGKTLALHPLMVLLAITAGAVTLGVLGAFLAVPVA